jgi:hypothetical protein
LIHGALGSATQLAELKLAIDGEHDVHVELEGHGNTPATEDQFTFDRFAANVRDFMRDRTIEVGDRDAIVSVDETASCLKSIPKGELAVLPDTPHPIEQVRVSLVASLIEDFLASQK